MSDSRLIMGAMSGTSADGVDAALVEVSGRGLAMRVKPLSHAYAPFTAAFRQQILEVRQRGDVRLADLAQIGRDVTLAYVEACRGALRDASVTADQLAAIAAHGQTLYHGPPNTIQYFDPSLLAWELNCTVVSDFRRADLAAGGQGAPLVPFADWILFRHPTKSRVILNIGGIANITYLKAGGMIDEVIAFDTGPGNCISDWIMRDSGGVDPEGRLARQGKVDWVLLQRCVDAPFITKHPPKSTDGPAMVELFARLAEDRPFLSLEDQLATAATFTVMAILESMPSDVLEIYAAGGGVRNETIMTHLRRQAEHRGIAVATLSSRSPATFEGDAAVDHRDSALMVDLAASREAIAFALLGAATLDGEPSNVPSATGAKRRVVLGSITPRP